ncbi:MAG: hypothetical protein ACYTGD_03365, partial [Planctomycetota bacterium]
MGIYDRDYIRSQPPPGREPGRGVLSGMRMWSVNTWLIVICVAVFVIDGFTGTTPVQIREPFLFDGIPGIPETAVIDGEPRAVSLGVKDAQGRIEPRHLRARPYLERPGGRQIGWVPVMEMNRLAA